jgi:hypothetical protein
MKPTIYIVTSYRWGNHQDHSYPIGAFTKKAQAIKAADSHAEYRGGKYECEVDEVTADQFDNGVDEYTKTIYKTKKL